MRPPARRKPAQVVPQVALVLDSHAQTDETVVHAAGDADLGRNAGMGHRRGVADERLDAAQTLGETEEPGVSQQMVGRLRTSMEPETDHATEGSHLPARKCMTGSLRKTGIVNLLDLRLPGQPGRQGLSIRAMAVHSHAEGLDTPQCQPGIERSGNAAGRVLVKLDRLKLFTSADHGAADQVGVAAQVLRRGVDDKVRAQRQRLLKIRRGERAVHREDRPVSVRQLGDGRDIQDLEQGVGRRFDPNQLGPRAHERGEALRLEVLGVARDDALGTEDTLEQAIGAPVKVGRGHDLVAVV